MSKGNFNPRPFASSITSVKSTLAPASCNGLATTWPAALMSKYFAPQRVMLYSVRAASMSHGGAASVGLLISVNSNEANYKKPHAESNKRNEKFLRRKTHLEIYQSTMQSVLVNCELLGVYSWNSTSAPSGSLH